MQACGVDYRTAYVVVGRTVRAASTRGRAGRRHHRRDDRRGGPWSTPGGTLGLAGGDLSAVLDPWQIVLSRAAQGGAAPDALAAMVTALRSRLDELEALAATRTAGFDRVEQTLLDTARAVVEEKQEKEDR